MPGLVPGIHVLGCPGQGVDGRDKPGHGAVEAAAPHGSKFRLDCPRLAGSAQPGPPCPATNVNSEFARERSIFTGKGRIVLGGPLDESD